MDYGQIVSESFRLSWRHKLLWIFGLFASGGPTGFNLDMLDRDEFNFEEMDILRDSLQDMGIGGGDFPLELLAPLLLAAGLMFLVFITMHLLSIPALIDAVNRLKRGNGIFRLGQSFSVGIDFFLRMLGLVLLMAAAVIMMMGVGILVIVVTIAIHWALTIMAALVIVPCFLVLIWVVTNVTSLAERSMVVRNAGIAGTIEEAWHLFRRNPKENFVIFLISIGLNIGIGLTAFIAWMIMGIPIAIVALGLGMSFIPTIFLVILIGLPGSLVIGGFTGAALFNIYTLFYFELVEPSQRKVPMPAPPPAVA